MVITLLVAQTSTTRSRRRAITASLTTVTTDQGDMITDRSTSGTTFDIQVQVQTILVVTDLYLNIRDIRTSSDQSFYIYPERLQNIDTSPRPTLDTH